jgi:small-conductance mechanosensitive channel
MSAAFLQKIDFSHVFTPTVFSQALRFIVIIVVGFIIVRLLAIGARRLFAHSLTEQSRMLLTRAVTYTGFAIIVIAALGDIGVKLSALLGAAGVVGVALGIASQASLSNIISGLFLVSEKALAVGDVVKIGSTTGIVHSIDPLSVKRRTFDNMLVRIPNQMIISSELTNITRFPIRRMDFTIGVAYKENLPRVREILLDIARRNPLCLDEPEPLFIFNTFGDSSIDILLGVWFEKSNYLDVKNSVFVAIKERFDAEGVEIPFPHRTLYTGSVTEPFPVRVVEPEELARTLDPTGRSGHGTSGGQQHGEG